MGDQYTGDCIVGLMGQVDKSLARPRSDVGIGGKIVKVGCLKVRVGPEVIESWKRIEAEKQAAIASGKPFTRGVWQTQDEQGKTLMKAIAAKAGFPGVFDDWL